MKESLKRIANRAAVRVPPPVAFLPMIIALAFHYLAWPLGFSLPEMLGGWITLIVAGGFVVLIGLSLQGLAVAEFRRTAESIRGIISR